MSKARDELLYDEMVKFENKVSKLEAENLKKDSIISDLQILKSEKFAMIKKIQKLEAEKAELIDVINTMGSLLDDNEIAQAQAVARYTILKSKGVVE